MKQKRYLFLFFTLLLSAMLLSACDGGLAASSWPGVTVDQDTIYISYATHVMAVNGSNGSLIWRYPEKADAKHSYYAPPELAGDQLIVGDYVNTVVSLNAKTGTQNWQFDQATGRFVGGALAINDLVLMPSVDHKLYALNSSGQLVWSFEAKNGLWARPVSDGSYVYLPSMDHNLYAIDLKTGNKRWETDLGGALVSSATLSEDGLLYIGTLANEVLAVNSVSGNVVWRFKTQGAVWSSPVLYEGILYLGDLQGTEYALDAATGTQKWKLDQLGSAIIASSTVTPDSIFVVTEDGNLVSINFDGQRQWTKTINGKLYTAPVIAGDKVVVSVIQGDNLLQAFQLTGTDAWSFVAPK